MNRIDSHKQNAKQAKIRWLIPSSKSPGYNPVKNHFRSWIFAEVKCAQGHYIVSLSVPNEILHNNMQCITWSLLCRKNYSRFSNDCGIK